MLPVCKNWLYDIQTQNSVCLSPVPKTGQSVPAPAYWYPVSVPEWQSHKIYSVSPEDAVTRLKEKLNKKIESLKKQGKEIRRLQINLTFSDIKSMKSFKRIY